MSNTPYRPWMHSLLDRMKELYGKTDAKTISEALPDGAFFEIKGSVATASNLPASGNKVGDIYIVTEDGGEYIWVTSETYPDGYWEKLGADVGGQFVVTLTESNGTYSADKTFSEIWTAYQANNSIIAVYNGEIFELDNILPLLGATFSNPYANSDGSVGINSFLLAAMGGNETWTHTEQALEPKKFVVTVTDDGQGNLSANKTFAEIYAAYQAGKTVVAVVDTLEFFLVQIYYESGIEGNAEFSLCRAHPEGAIVVGCSVYYDGQDETWSTWSNACINEPAYGFVQGATPSITPENNCVYKCGTLTSLTITNPPATGSYVIKFTSGSTATTTTIPSSIKFPEAFAAEANMRYEINVEDGYAVAVGWPTT